jgi:hypothetical protein
MTANYTPITVHDVNAVLANHGGAAEDLLAFAKLIEAEVIARLGGLSAPSAVEQTAELLELGVYSFVGRQTNDDNDAGNLVIAPSWDAALHEFKRSFYSDMATADEMIADDESRDDDQDSAFSIQVSEYLGVWDPIGGTITPDAGFGFLIYRGEPVVTEDVPCDHCGAVHGAGENTLCDQ